MIFIAEKEVIEYMQRKNRHAISVEVASTDHSDIEITELFLRTVKDHFAAYLVDKKKYRKYPLLNPAKEESGLSVLLPQYAMDIEETVRFGLKKRWIFSHLYVEGIQI